MGIIITAIIFAVGGYFIGKGTLKNQGASLYQATNSAQTTTMGTGDIASISKADCAAKAKKLEADYFYSRIYGCFVTIANNGGPGTVLNLVKKSACEAEGGQFLESSSKPGYGACRFVKAFEGSSTAQ